MTNFTRRKFLHDLSVVSAAAALPWPLGCKCTCNDLFVLLEGPWVVSIAHPLYMRAVTTRMGYDAKGNKGSPMQATHYFQYFDPRNTGDSGCHRELSGSRMIYFDVYPHRDQSQPQDRRDKLFSAMRQNRQGLFYNSDVSLPDKFDSSRNTLELQVSYPDEIIPLGLHDGVTFTNLECVEGQKISLWPSVLLLRYKRWRSAAFFGDQCDRESINPDSGEVHRKLSIEFSAGVPINCANLSIVTKAAVDHFADVMSLLQAKQTLPVPAFPGCDGDNVTSKCWGPVTKAEMDATYPSLAAADNRATSLVNCAAGGGGIVGGH